VESLEALPLLVLAVLTPSELTWKSKTGLVMAKERIGFIGLGIMGSPMCRNILNAGFPLVVNDVATAPMEALAKLGAATAASPAELAREADILITCLPNADIVEQVVTGENGILAGSTAGQVYVDMTTNYPPVSVALAERLAGHGIGMLDAPVSGGSGGAEAGTLSIMCGGATAVFDRCMPVFEAMGQRITLMGESVGMGGYAKLTNQIMVSIHFASLAEALVFAAKAGLDMKKLIPALEAGWANSTVLNVKAPQILARDFTPVGTVAVQHKDLSYITRSMEDMGIDLPFCGQIKAMYEQLIDQGKSGIDQMALIHLFEAMAGVEVKA